MTSEKPSPLTSPAVDTETPKWAPDWSLSAVQAGDAASPDAVPRKTYARPSSAWPLSNPSAPTMTSAKASPFTSPAEATETPNPANDWSHSADQMETAAGPDGEP